MQELLQKQKQLTGLRGTSPTRPAGPTPRRGMLADIVDPPAPAPVPAATSEARTLDIKGRVRLADTAAAVGVTAGDKVCVEVDVTGVMTVTPYEGETLDSSGDTVVLDSRGRITLPAWARSYADVAPGDAVMCVAADNQIQIVGSGAFLRLRSSTNEEERTL